MSSQPGRATAWPPARKTGAVRVRLDDGREVLAKFDAVEELADGTYRLSLGSRAGDSATDAATVAAAAKTSPEQGMVVPVVEEQVSVGKRVVETGRLRVRKIVREEEEPIDQALLREELVVERVPVERFVTGPQPVREEGDVTIVPIVEEVVVVEKRLLLKEEVRIRRQVVQVREQQTVTVRREEVSVERVPTGKSSD